MKKYLIAAVLLLSSSMAFAIGTDSTMRRVMSSWQGYSADSLMKVWGYPTEEKTIAGKHLLYWITNDETVINNDGYYNQAKKGNGGYYSNTSTIEEDYCKRIIEVGPNNKIVGGSYEGNDCPMTYIFGASRWVNPDNDLWQIEKANRKK